MAHAFSKMAVASESDDEINVEPHSRLPPSQIFQSDRGASTITTSRDVAAAAGDYFAPNAATSHSVGAAGPPLSFVQYSEYTEALRPDSSQVPLSDSPYTRRPSLPQETLSDSSTATIAPQPLRLVQVRYPPQRSYTEYPQYPNQSFAALQSQKHPERHRPPFMSRPVPLHPASTVSSPGYAPREGAASRDYRTAGNTPVHTPGLFIPRFGHRPVTSQSSDSARPLQSPYLHPMQQSNQQAPPKETNTADRNVDWLTGRKMINQYEIYYELGAGVHGKVKLARNLLTGKLVAIKIVRRYSKRRRLGKSASDAEDKVKRELAILKKVHHPNIVTMLEVIDDPEMTKVYIVLEFCEKREIDWRTEGAPEIVVLENRRLERESRGAIDADIHIRESSRTRAAEESRNQSNHRPHHIRNKRSHEITVSSDDEDAEREGNGQISAYPSRTPSKPQAPKVHRGENSNDSYGLEVSPSRERDPVAADESKKRIYNHESRIRQPLNEANFGRRKQSFPSLWSDEIPQHAGIDGIDDDCRPGEAESTLSQVTALMNHEVPKESQYVPTMTIAESRFAFRDALLGLEYLHYHGIIHRDIKPANLLRTQDSRVKISDFGVSYLGKPVRDSDSEPVSDTENGDVEEETELAKTVGTPSFYAPELCSLDFIGKMPAVTGQIDVWALGVTLYCILFGRTPFTGENEFALMKSIAEDKVFIPRKRLKAVQKPPVIPIKESDETPGEEHVELLGHEILEDNCSPAPHEPHNSSPTDDQRLPTQWVHEDIDDELYDLLHRLLIKDPAKRITLKEVKHHPWVLQDIMGQHVVWLDETDPARHTQGKKIEISKEEVADAVIPLKAMERARSLVKRVGGAVGGAFGIRGRNSRKRAESPAVLSEKVAESSTLPTSSSTTSKSAKRSSLRSVYGSTESVVKLPREEHGERPLSQSIMPDPDVEHFQDGFSTKTVIQNAQPSPHLVTSQRPIMPERQTSLAGSTKTIRQSDIDRLRSTPSPTPSYDLPGSSNTTNPHDTSNFGPLLGQANPNLRTAMRSRERTPIIKDSELGFVSSPSIAASEVPYEVPSIALSNASVAGDIPASRSLGSSAEQSTREMLNSSRSDSVMALSESPDTLPLETRAEQTSMTDSPSRTRISHVNVAGGLTQYETNYLPPDHEPTDEEWRVAKATLLRRTLLDFEHEREHLRNSRPGSAMSPDACPPSPDDDENHAQQLSSATSSPRSTGDYFAEMSPRTTREAFAMQSLSATSSRDRLTSGFSQSSTSFPSMPSVLTAESSVIPERRSTEDLKDDVSSDGTTHALVPTTIEYVPHSKSNSARGETMSKTRRELGSSAYTYDGDEAAVQTDEDDSDSESEVLQMRSKRHPQAVKRSTSISIAQLSRGRHPRVTPSKKTARNGSSNTVKKVVSYGEGAVGDGSRGRPRE